MQLAPTQLCRYITAEENILRVCDKYAMVVKTASWSAVLLLLLLGVAASLASAQYLASTGEWCGDHRG